MPALEVQQGQGLGAATLVDSLQLHDCTTPTAQQRLLWQHRTWILTPASRQLSHSGTKGAEPASSDTCRVGGIYTGGPSELAGGAALGTHRLHPQTASIL